MTPTFSTGTKTAERAPIAIRALPSRRRCHSSKRSPAESPLCMMAARLPKRARSWESICGVREISGTKKIAVCPRASARAMRVR